MSLLRIKQASCSISICGCNVFFITVSEPEKRKAFCTEERWTFCPQEMPVRKHVALAGTLGISLSTLNTVVIKRTDIGMCHPQCGRVWNSHHFKTWRAGWPQGVNGLQLAVWWSLTGCWEKRLHALPQAWLLKISEHLMAGLMVSRVTHCCVQNCNWGIYKV